MLAICNSMSGETMATKIVKKYQETILNSINEGVSLST